MTVPLRVLIVEDSEDDALLLVEALRRGGYDPVWRRVETPEALAAALAEGRWDLLLADYRLPAFSAPAALALIQHARVDVPFLIVSGTIGEEQAVTALKAGAHDFLLKDNLARLVPAVERELREAENRRRRATAETALRESEERYRGLMEGLPVGVYRTTPEGVVLEANGAMARLLGYSGPDGLLGTNAGRMYADPADRDRWRAAVEDRGPDAVLELSVRRADGRVIWVRDTSRAVRDEHGAVRWYDGVLEDITARRQVEAALARRQAELETLVEHAPDSITRYDRDLRFTYVSPGAVRPGGAPRDGRIGRRPTEIDPGRESARRWEQLVADVFASGRERAAEWPCGSDERWAHVQLVPETDPEGGVASVLVIGRDITPLKRAQQRLQSREAHFRGLIENATDMIAILDAAGLVRYLSPSVERTLGYGAEALLGRSVFELVHPDDRPRVRAEFDQMIRDPQRQARTEHRLRHADGTWHTLESAGTNLLADPAVSGIVINSRDVTARVKLEEQLRQAQKLEAIGRLAGGVAHDFNNVLTVIRANGEFLLDQLPSTDPRRVDVEEIRDAADRAGVLTRQLLAFSRRQVVQPQVLDLNEVVTETARMFGRLIGEDVVLALDLDPAAGCVLADVGQLEQVLLNLCVNARDAMPGGGRLTLTTRGVELDAAAAGADDLPPGRYAELSVADTGTGMTPAVMGRMFEPFFTTKERGTGLGLATVYGIVRQASGHIGAVSAPGRGTTFTVRLPAAAAARPGGAAPAPGAELPHGTETVLLVEDEAPVRSTARRLLERCGYRVLEADSGERAVEIAEAFDGPIGLVIADVVMPRMGGPAAARHILARRPGTPVLYVTGYADDTVSAHGVLEPGSWLLQKPFSLHGLASKVREILDGTAAVAGRT